MIALSAKIVARKIRKRTTAAERNRAGNAFNPEGSRSRKLSEFGVNSRKFLLSLPAAAGENFRSSKSDRLHNRRGRCRRFLVFAFAANNGV